MASPIDALPVELKDRVLSHLSQGALCSMVRVSSTWKNLVLPFLYKELNLNAGQSEAIVGLYELAHTLLTNPSIASLVECFSIRNEWDEGGEATESPWPEDSKDILRKHVERITESAEEAESWLEELHSGNQDYAVALLLPLLPRLRKFDICPGAMYGDSESGLRDRECILQLLERVGTRSPPFEDGTTLGNLSDVMICGTDDKYPDSPEFFYPLMRLPSLRHFYAFRVCHEDHHEGSESVFAPDSLNVESIELHYSKIHPLEIKSLLRACKALKSFIYDLGDTWAWVQIDMKSITHGLNLQKQTLEVLSLTHDWEFCPFNQDDLNDGGTPEPPINMHQLHAVKTLRIGPVFLFGLSHLEDADEDSDSERQAAEKLLRENLPPNVQKLVLANFFEIARDAHLLGALVDFLAHYELATPHLTQLVLESNFKGTVEPFEELRNAATVIEAAAAKGLACKASQDSAHRLGPDSPWGFERDVHWRGYEYDQTSGNGNGDDDEEKEGKKKEKAPKRKISILAKTEWRARAEIEEYIVAKTKKIEAVDRRRAEIRRNYGVE